jgi:hypothetical protein
MQRVYPGEPEDRTAHDDITRALLAVRATHGDGGLRAVALFMQALGDDVRPTRDADRSDAPAGAAVRRKARALEWSPPEASPASDWGRPTTTSPSPTSSPSTTARRADAHGRRDPPSGGDLLRPARNAGLDRGLGPPGRLAPPSHGLGEGDDKLQAHAGETWQYRGSVRKVGGAVHSFRHRCHPVTRGRVYACV